MDAVLNASRAICRFQPVMQADNCFQECVPDVIGTSSFCLVFIFHMKKHARFDDLIDVI